MKLLSSFILCCSALGLVHAQDSILSSHILDISRGAPAQNVSITLEKKVNNEWSALETVKTNQDGRVNFMTIHMNDPATIGIYRLNFQTQSYFKEHKVETFYPEVDVIFEIKDETSHYHVPITLSPYGYSTYRGS